MPAVETKAQLDEFFERVDEALAGSDNEVYTQIERYGADLFVAAFWRGRDWSTDLTLYRIPDGTDLADLDVDSDDCLGALAPWRMRDA